MWRRGVPTGFSRQLWDVRPIAASSIRTAPQQVARGGPAAVSKVRQGGYNTCQPIERSFGGRMSWCTYCQMDVDAGRKRATMELRTVGRAKFPNDLSISRTNDKHSRVVAFPRVDHGVRKVLSHSKLTRFLQSTPGRMCHLFYQRL